MKRGFFFIGLILAGFIPKLANAAPPELKAAGFSSQNGTVLFRATLSQATSVKIFGLADPSRLVIDLPEITVKTDLKAIKTQGTPVSALRSGLFAPGTFRIVLDLKEPVIAKAFAITQKDGNFVMQFELAPVPAADYAAAIKKNVIKTDGLSQNIVSVPEKPVQQALRPVPPPKPVSKKASKLALIVIDPGHGGVDPGAISTKGRYEKELTLAFAKLLKQTLENSGRYRVILTRDQDVFIPLRGRIAVARRAGADLFISLHADSHAKADARGATVYTLSETASDAEAAALAAKENRSDIIAGINLSGENDTVTDILINLAQRETLNQSLLFSGFLVQELRKSVVLQNRPQRSAGFAVLKAPDVPSVLIELGYLSNGADESLLNSKTHRAKLAQAILRAVDTFFKKRAGVTIGGTL